MTEIVINGTGDLPRAAGVFLEKIGENRIHTLHSLSGWYVDGMFRGNYFALKPNADKTVIVHADVPPAKVITTEISHLSAGIPSSRPEADGKLNGGKKKEEPSVQQVGQSPQPNGTQFKSNGGYSQKPNGCNNPNGFQSDK